MSTIKINGQERGIKFGLGAFEIYCDEMDCDMAGLDKVFSIGRDQLRAIPALILAGLKNYAEINDEPFDLNIRKVQAWIDETDQETISAIIQEFSKSQFLGRTLMQTNDSYQNDDDKEALKGKKAPKKRSASVK